MADIWFIADTHFDHANIIHHASRAFSNVINMDIGVLYSITKTIKPRDTVYCLGDFIWKRKLIKQYARVLPGKWTVIPGNHDESFKNELSKYFKFTQRLHHIKINKRLFVLCHYPLDTWNGSHHGSVHLHGHSHGTLKGKRNNRFDVGWDVWKRPVNYEEIMELLR